MTTSATADLRWLRAALVAVVATAIGTVAHVAAGGLLPGAAVLVALGALLTVVSAAALGHPATYAALALLVAGGQLVVHLVLTAISGHGGAHPAVVAAEPISLPAGGVRSQLEVVSTATTLAPATTPHFVEHLRDDLTGPNLLMALAHLAAAAGVAAWLHVGERALWTLVALLGAHVCARVCRSWWLTRPAPAVVLDRGTPPAPFNALARRLRAATRALGRRGPPLPLLPFAPTV